MVPYIRRLAVDQKGWADEQSFISGMACAQTLPGATAMQVAAYAGLRAGGVAGALAAYVGFGLPAFLLITGLSWLYFTARDVPVVLAVFDGLQGAVSALVAAGATDFARRYLDRFSAWGLAGVAAVWLGLGGNPILALLFCCGAACFLFRDVDGRPSAASQTAAKSEWPLLGMLLGLFAGGIGLLLVLFPVLGDLALLMVKVDLFAFGGGYVSVPIMLHEIVESRGWMSESMFMDGIALGQVTPGPIVMTGAFVGYALTGFWGALVAAVAVFGQSFFLLCGVVPFYDRFSGSAMVQRALRGSLVSLVGLMAAVALRFSLAVDWQWWNAALALLAFGLLLRGLDVVRVVLGIAAVSALVGLMT